MYQLSARGEYLCCIFEIDTAMKILIKPAKATGKAPLRCLFMSVHHCVSLWCTIQKLLESSWKLVHLHWKKECRHRHLNYSIEKAAIKGIVKIPSVHRCTKSHTKVRLLILAGMLCLHFTSCLHAKSHQLEQSWTVCSWHSAMQYLKGIYGQPVAGMNFITGRKMQELFAEALGI